ncbi:hypothetical protein KDM87_17510 [Undibacterium sp. FT147W]|uniref:Uncharacterized protein n=1 Tax=Undibacterium rivi TaxID=2828729 RepID=A0ABS5H6A4_9BURK|nr:hypothetical protein [Undibacterium rivi]MBR7794396.1 hypothetical protein [Undibacterium rivi]
MAPKSRKESFLKQLMEYPSIESPEYDLVLRCKFNFSYFTKQDAGQSFGELTHENLISLCEKLCHYSKESLLHWKKEQIGKKSGHVLEIYESFPKKSDFTEPKSVPHQAQWARFRIDSSTRLVGFVVPDKFHDTMHDKGCRFDKNTFYIVFIDENHVFYKT